jgi:ATP-dependent DNA helicase RecG
LKYNFISVKSVAEQTGTLQRTVEYNIKKLRDLGIIVRHGGARYGYWELKE